MEKNNSYNWLRWSARILGTLFVVLTLIIGGGELIESLKRNTGSLLSAVSPIIIIIFLIWGVALAGLILAFWKEGLGGIISLISFMLMYILNLFNKEASMRGSAITIFLVFSIPSILYLIYWKLKKG